MSITDVAPAYEKMELKELHADAAKTYKQSQEIIDAGKQKGGLSEDEYKALGDLMQQVDSIEAVISRKESEASLFNRARAGVDKYSRPYQPFTHADPEEREGDGGERRGRDTRTIGRRFVESAEYKAAYNSGRVPSWDMFPRVEQRYENYSLLEHKTLIAGASSTSGGPLVQNDVQPVFRDPRRPLTFLDLITRLTTGSDTIEWPEETFTNAAASVAEATSTTGTSGTKAESALSYATKTSPVEAIAHWIPVTMRMLADASAIRGLVDAALMVGLDETLETQLLSGNGTSPQLDGLTHLTGVQDHAIGSDSNIDALFKMIVKVQVTGKSMPTAAVLNPLNFQTIRLARENAATATLGAYLYGSPAMAGPMTVWGYPVVEAQGLTANTGLVGDFSARRMVLWDREQAVIRTGYIDQMFVRNMIAILAELRCAFTVMRQTAVAKCSGLT